MTDEIAVIPGTDAEGVAAFKRFDELLSKVQVGSPFRARGAELRAARKAYHDYLPILQPIGQRMIDRVVATMDAIQSRLKLPPGYRFIIHNYHDRHYRKFIAGEFQLNYDASLTIRPEGDVDDSAFGAEIRLFTRKVEVFVPMWIGWGAVARRNVNAFGNCSFARAATYEELAEAIVVAVQAALDQYQADRAAAESSRESSVDAVAGV